jgi:hypothetical protein
LGDHAAELVQAFAGGGAAGSAADAFIAEPSASAVAIVLVRVVAHPVKARHRGRCRSPLLRRAAAVDAARVAALPPPLTNCGRGNSFNLLTTPAMRV